MISDGIEREQWHEMSGRPLSWVHHMLFLIYFPIFAISSWCDFIIPVLLKR